MKTRKILSLLLLVIVLACQKDKDSLPQPDWASKFEGTYLSIYDPSVYGDNFLQSSEYDIDFKTNVAYLTSFLVLLERVDNTHVNINMILKPFSLTFTGHKRTILPAIKYLFKNVRVVDSTTLVIEETALDSKGNILLKPDTIKFDIYKTFKFKQIGDQKGNFSIDANKYFNDASPSRLFYSMTTVNKFELHKRYFFAYNDGIKYEWSFGDGGTSTEENPYHEYKSNGLYDITYAVTDKSGKKYTIEDKVGVTNLPY